MSKWDVDPPDDTEAILALERQEDEETERLERLELKSEALHFFTRFIEKLDRANRGEFRELKAKIDGMSELLKSAREEIDF